MSLDFTKPVKGSRGERLKYVHHFPFGERIIHLLTTEGGVTKHYSVDIDGCDYISGEQVVFQRTEEPAQEPFPVGSRVIVMRWTAQFRENKSRVVSGEVVPAPEAVNGEKPKDSSSYPVRLDKRFSEALGAKDGQDKILSCNYSQLFHTINDAREAVKKWSEEVEAYDLQSRASEAPGSV